MKMKLLLLTILTFSFSVQAHCPLDLKEVNLCANLDWIDGPNLNQKSHFEISFWEKGDHTHTPVQPSFDVNIYPWMIMNNGHGHGGPAFTIENTTEGLFEVRDARFFMGTMRGYWEVRLDIKDGSQLISHARSKVEL